MNFENIIIEIEDIKNAHDVLYGNSPKQMFKRALKNKIVLSIEKEFRNNSSLNLFLFFKFQRFLKKCPVNNFYADATASLYLSVFSKSKSFEIFKKLGDILPQLNNQSLLFQLIYLSRQELFKSINPQLTIPENKRMLLHFNYQSLKSQIQSSTQFSYIDFIELKSDSARLIELK